MTPTQIMNGPAKEVAQYIATAPLNDSYNITYAVINALNRIHALEQQVQELAAAPQLTPEERSATEAIKAIPTAKVESFATASTAPINKVAFDPNGETPMTDRAEIIFCPPHTRTVELNRCQDIERKYNWAMTNWNDCHAELQATKEDLTKANEKRKTAQWHLQKSRESEQRLHSEVAQLRMQVAAADPNSAESQQLREQIQRLEAELAFAREMITAKNKRIQAALKVNT